MANPQPDQYIRISAEFMDALCKIRIPGEARQIFDCIIRKTWGWNKKEDAISLSQFASMTNVSRRNVRRAVLTLELMQMVSVKKDTGNITSYSIQKDYDKWVGSVKKDTGVRSDTTPVSKKRTKVVSKKRTTIDKIDNIQKTTTCNEPQKPLNPDDYFKDDPVLKPISDTAKAMNYFFESFEKKTSKKYVANFAKEGALFKDILKVIPIADLMPLMDKYFATDDDFIIKAGYTIGLFKTQINKLQTTGEKYGHLDPSIRKYMRDPKSR